MTFNTSDSTKAHAFSSLTMRMDTLVMDSLDVESEIIILDDSLRKEGQSNGFKYSWSSGPKNVDVKKEIRRFTTDSGSQSMITNLITSNDSSNRFNFEHFSQLTQKIIISTSEQQIDLEELKGLLDEELKRKNLAIGYQLDYESDGDKVVLSEGQYPYEYPLSTNAKSTYLSGNELLKVNFENASLLILKRGIWDLLLSLAIVLSVIGALLYLYRVIRTQKELAMIKDDLIGNVTHEFKTPIATVISALEGIANFNESNDKEKTTRYLKMSQDQLAKLNVMVEKLMETATIDSGEIEINKVETDLMEMTNHVVQNFRVRIGEKQLKAELPEGSLWAMVDSFHWENVMSNLLDNAIKYGGEQITVRLEKAGAKIRFQVIDNGGNIEKVHKDRVFNKLYRIPKGNQHDVKGFGIGLYYTKSIVEQHGGQISLEVSANRTCFTVSL